MSKVVVLKGGRSLEREVSLRSGANVEGALRRLGHDVVGIDVDQHLVRTLRAEAPDAAFIAMHGRGGEDGTVQELLEILEIPYTGSGVRACERSVDKVVAKAIFRAAGIPTPPSYAFGEEAFRELGAADTLVAIRENLGMPLVVKPAKQGSALGVTIARDPGEIPSALMSALSYDDRVLLKGYVAGREIAVSVLGTDDAVTLPAVEPVPRQNESYDFEARYTAGMTDFIAPADLTPRQADEAARLALACYREIGCRTFGRVDMILDGDGAFHVLEIDTIPGLTDTSLMPKAAQAAGMAFDELIARVLELAALGG